ncbi:MAG: cation transporter [Syntrophaceae bacterium]|nr:cation transporter [Syntrophaceae bacterium]NTW60152.1 cation transporter [Nitrospirota bacterium]
MQTLIPGFVPERKKLYTWASVLALITIFYNIGEGLVSVFLGIEDESFALLGFGLDSFVEVSSGTGIWHMIGRIRKHGSENPDKFEKTALRLTGSGFYVLTAGLAVIAAVNLYQGHKPETTFWGIVISLISIVTMWLLIRYKVKVGRELNSQAILSDAACTRACLQLSVVLLVSSVGYKFTGIGGFDSVGTLVIAGLCWHEGKEAFEKARAGSFACACGGECKTDTGIQ